MKPHLIRVLAALGLLAAFNPQLSTRGQGTSAFTYQGQLRDGSTNANGAYTMMFKLYDALGSGSQIGSAVTTSPTLANGLFSVNLDFGAGVFNGNARWLDITITNGGTTQTLSPRVQVLPSPYAIFAASAGSVANGAIQNPTFLGTTGLTPFTLYANNQPALRIQPFTNTANIIAGYSGNLVSNGFVGATIGGGGASIVPEASDGLPSANIVGANYATVSGGARNRASGLGSTVPGGFANAASGLLSFAAGVWANSIHDYSFVWNDGSAGFGSTTSNQFSVHAHAGARFETDGSGLTVDGKPAVTAEEKLVMVRGIVNPDSSIDSAGFSVTYHPAGSGGTYSPFSIHVTSGSGTGTVDGDISSQLQVGSYYTYMWGTQFEYFTDWSVVTTIDGAGFPVTTTTVYFSPPSTVSGYVQPKSGMTLYPSYTVTFSNAFNSRPVILLGRGDNAPTISSGPSDIYFDSSQPRTSNSFGVILSLGVPILSYSGEGFDFVAIGTR